MCFAPIDLATEGRAQVVDESIHSESIITSTFYIVMRWWRAVDAQFVDVASFADESLSHPGPCLNLL